MSRVRRALGAPVLALLLITGLAGCTDHGSETTSGGGAADGSSGGDGGAPTGGRAPRPEEPAVRTTTTYGTVTGKLAHDRRARLKQGVTDVVDAYLEAAYVEARGSGSRLGRAFPHFTDGAEVAARRDARVLSNLVDRRRPEVKATKRKVVLDVLALDGTPVAVTARFVLAFEAAGGRPRAEEVRGRLFLTRPGDTWRVFGYDVARGGRARSGGGA